MTKRNPGPPLTERQLLDRCVEEGDCQVWQQATRADGAPMVWSEGQATSARRVMWGIVKGRPAFAGYCVIVTCGQPRCMTFSHMRCITTSQQNARLRRLGVFDTPFATIRRTQGARARPRNVFDMDKAREVRRLHAEGHGAAAIARMFGTNRETAHQVITGKTWREEVVNGASVFAWRG